MTNHETKETGLQDALKLYGDGFPPDKIYLEEKEVFPGLIKAARSTGRKARSTGTLLGREAPKYVKTGHRVRYKLSDVLEWLDGFN